MQPPNGVTCDIKVLFLLYTPTKKLLFGLVPNNQPLFIDRLRKFMQTKQGVVRHDEPNPGGPSNIPGTMTDKIQANLPGRTVGEVAMPMSSMLRAIKAEIPDSMPYGGMAGNEAVGPIQDGINMPSGPFGCQIKPNLDGNPQENKLFDRGYDPMRMQLTQDISTQQLSLMQQKQQQQQKRQQQIYDDQRAQFQQINR